MGWCLVQLSWEKTSSGKVAVIAQRYYPNSVPKDGRADVVREATALDARGDASPGEDSAASRLSPFQVLVTSFVALGLLAFFLWQAPLAQVAETLRRVQLGWVVAAVGFSLLSYALRALRWGAILKPVGTAPAPALLGCTAAGFAINTILPGRLGEVARPLLLARRTGLAPAATLASILTERLIDLATLLAVFAAGVVMASERLAPTATAVLRHTALVAACGLVVAFAVVLVLLRLRHTAVPAAARLAPRRWRQKVERFLDHLLDGLEAVRSLRRLALLTAWSAAVWGTAILQIDLLARGFQLSLGVAASAVVIGVSVIGLAVPAPAGVGSFHAAIQFALATLLGADVANATAFAIVHHAVCFLPITLAGLAYMVSVGFRPSAAAALAARREE